MVAAGVVAAGESFWEAGGAAREGREAGPCSVEDEAAGDEREVGFSLAGVSAKEEVGAQEAVMLLRGRRGLGSQEAESVRAEGVLLRVKVAVSAWEAASAVAAALVLHGTAEAAAREAAHAPVVA